MVVNTTNVTVKFFVQIKHAITLKCIFRSWVYGADVVDKGLYI